MGFLKDVKRDLRGKGVWLDAEQARILLGIALRGPDDPFSPKEEDVIRRLEQRCRELHS